IFKSSGILNFAQGEFLLLGAYVFLAIVAQANVPTLPALLLTFAFATLLGLALERVILRPLIGEPIISVIMVTLGLSSVLRGIAAVVSAAGGILLGTMRGGVDGSLAILGLKVLPVVIVGGLDSVGGAILGGLLVGVLENLAGGYLDPVFGGGVKEVAPFVALVLILMVRPYGLFGKVRIERV